MSTDKVQHISDKSKGKVLRGTPAPEEVRKAIELENCLLPDQQVPTLLNISRAQAKISERDLAKALQYDGSGPRPSFENKDVEWRLEAYQTVIQDLPERLQEFIGPVTHETLDQAYANLYFLSQTIEIIRIIAYANRESDASPLSYYIPATLILKTDHKGRIRYSPSPFLEALEGIEAARIRLCPFCGKVYWASRKDRPGCSPECGRNLRARKWRERYKEKYTVQRYEKNNKEAALERREAKEGRK